jgi:hypothetical protein
MIIPFKFQKKSKLWEMHWLISQQVGFILMFATLV